jgi:hypothetical protein
MGNTKEIIKKKDFFSSSAVGEEFLVKQAELFSEDSLKERANTTEIVPSSEDKGMSFQRLVMKGVFEEFFVPGAIVGKSHLLKGLCRVIVKKIFDKVKLSDWEEDLSQTRNNTKLNSYGGLVEEEKRRKELLSNARVGKRIFEELLKVIGGGKEIVIKVIGLKKLFL